MSDLTSAEIMGLEDAHTSGLYTKRPIAIVRGEGARLWDADGRMYIDCVGGQGSANVGHANPHVADAIAEQARRLVSCTEIFYNDQRALLLQRLTQIAPNGMDRAFLCNSGAEAIEGAIKFARMTTGRTGIVATMRGFHGRTMGALSATWEKKYREPFQPLVPGFSHVPYNDMDKLAAAITDETAAVLVEPVQGEGGVRPAAPGYLEGVAELCRERGALLIADEIQTGFGRTGRMFAVEHSGVTPDLMCLAKSVAGGMPMGAVLLGPRVGKLEPLTHGTTFGGNPLACAAALAAIDYIVACDLPARSASLGAHAVERLRAIDAPEVREVRGLGLMLGVELRHKVTPVLQALMARGVLALPAGPTVLRLLPPLVIEPDELDTALDAIEAVLAEVVEPTP
ncbi:MAG: aspartate aminotransferase family protein [Anaerolineae bacterium]